MRIDYTTSAVKYIENNKNINKSINDTLDLFPLLYCLSNINILITYFGEHKEDFINSNKKLSKVFSEICKLREDNNIKDFKNFEIIQNLIGKDKEQYE